MGNQDRRRENATGYRTGRRRLPNRALSHTICGAGVRAVEVLYDPL